MSDKSGDITQEQIQEISARYQQYHQQVEAITQQINVLQVTIRDLDTALTTIVALKNETSGKETLVPIGFGSFVNATITNPDKVIIGIGAGISVEKKIDEAKDFLEERKIELTKYHEKLNEGASKLISEMQNIEKFAQKYEKTQQQKVKQKPQQTMRAG